MPKKVKQTQAPGSSKSITIHVRSARNPALEFSVPNAPLSTTSVQDLRDAVSERVTDTQGNPIALDKIKILYRRKPVSSTGKTIAEILADEPDMLAGGKAVEFGVMIIGGATLVDTAESQSEAVEERENISSKPAIVPSGAEMLQTEVFWDDLQGYLEQQLKDEQEAKRLRLLFKEAWVSRR